jgi:hypothetical protein
VIATGEDSDFVIPNLIDQTMFLVDSPRPATGQLVFKRFRPSLARKWIAMNILHEFDDP